MSDDLDGPKATNPTGEAKNDVLQLDFDRRVMVQFRGSVVTSDAGLLAYRELDDVLGLSDLAGELLGDGRTGKNSRHALVGMLRQSVFGRLAGYEDVNDNGMARSIGESFRACQPVRKLDRSYATRRIAY